MDRSAARTRKILIICITALAFALRIAFLLAFQPDPPAYDALCYDRMVIQWLQKGIYAYCQDIPNAYVTPGYPLFLATIYRLCGWTEAYSPFDAVRLVQIALSAGTVYMLYRLGAALSSPRTGLIAAFFAAVYPVAWWVPTTILTEEFYVFLFILYLLMQVRAISRNTAAAHFLAGAVFGAAVMVRPLIAPLIALPYILEFFRRPPSRLLFKTLVYNFIAAFAGSMLIMAPWWIRNGAVFGKFIPFATQADPLLRGTYPYGEGIENMPLPPADQTAEALRRIKDGFGSDFVRYLKWYTFGKFDWLYMKIYFYAEGASAMLRPLLNIHYVYVAAGWLAAAGAFFKREMLLPSLFAILITTANMVFVATSRYAYPVMYLLILLAAWLADYVLPGRKSVRAAVSL